MKILPIDKVREADKYTIENEPVDSIELMERAARECYKWIYKRIKRGERVKIFAGPGNNGGDGLALGRLLGRQKIPVDIYVIRFTEKSSPDFRINYERLELVPEVRVHNLREKDPLPELTENDVVVDAIFGSGLSKPVKGFVSDVIDYINDAFSRVISIDIPSGLFSDTCSRDKGGTIIKADHTLSFQFPKYAFFFAENDAFVGKWEILSIGLHPDYIDEVEVTNHYVLKEDVILEYQPRNKYAHKGNFGHALLISGCYGKMGAAVLASRACMRSGAGLLTTHIPVKGYDILQTSVPESMVSLDEDDEVFTRHPSLDPYNAIGIGPGLGLDERTQNALKLLIQNTDLPLIIDADAINILGENKTWISFLPQGSILTPHPKEFERIAGKSGNCFDRVKMQRAFAVKHQVYVVLKGAHTSICCPDGTCFFNSTGNPGMATGGSGDVLTGIILGLMAQGYPSKVSAVMGVFLHGMSADIAMSRISQEAMIAGDLIEYTGRAFKELVR